MRNRVQSSAVTMAANQKTKWPSLMLLGAEVAQRPVARSLSEDDAVKEKTRINLEEIGPGSDLAGGDQLPESLNNLVERSLTLHQRVIRLDQMISERSEFSGDSDNPVGDQVGKLAEIFTGPASDKAIQG